ncbi:hypothetical protein TIFTF001_024565 [Ficus carica]|uniref:Uncharacterized protein n=1 Tax=Ficus carica TaxID=3494 RepID=A0AA88AMQ3_FICCA|nr:hypothetical protein TIFTF001_024565 [Ficus carica]
MASPRPGLVTLEPHKDGEKVAVALYNIKQIAKTPFITYKLAIQPGSIEGRMAEALSVTVISSYKEKGLVTLEPHNNGEKVTAALYNIKQIAKTLFITYKLGIQLGSIEGRMAEALSVTVISSYKEKGDNNVGLNVLKGSC